MSLTREEAIAAYLKDKTSVQVKSVNNKWIHTEWPNLSPLCSWDPEEWRFTPRVVPPGTLTWEEAKRRHEAGEKVQFSYRGTAWGTVQTWFVAASQCEIESAAYRLAPEPRKVPLGRRELHPGVMLRWGYGEFDSMVITAGDSGVWVFGNGSQVRLSYKELAKDGFADYSEDGGKTWKPCWKEEA